METFFRDKPKPENGPEPEERTSVMPDFLDFHGLARKLGTSPQWVRRMVRPTYSKDPIPHFRFGRAIKFAWNSPEMQAWLERRKKSAGPGGHEQAIIHLAPGLSRNRKEKN
jgi:hypothetical protein